MEEDKAFNIQVKFIGGDPDHHINELYEVEVKKSYSIARYAHNFCACDVGEVCIFNNHSTH
jgi:hypothetical protein